MVLEGDTEEVFYPLIRDKFLIGIRVELRNIKGQGNVNRDVASEIFKYTYNNSHDLVRVYCCVDTERQKQSATPFDLPLVCQQIQGRHMEPVLSIDGILADPDIESWFFHDVEGIYAFLKAKKSQRKTKKYATPTNLSKKDLQRLFAQFGRAYIPGRRAQHFIQSLDIANIVSCCKGLSDGIQLIRSQAKNCANHLFL